MSIRYIVKDNHYPAQSPKRDFFTREEAQAHADSLGDSARYSVSWMEVSGKRTKNLVGSAGGHKVTIRTAADYSYAAYAILPDKAVLMAKGFSYDSVRSRGRTVARKSYLGPATVVVIALHEEFHPVVEEYFDQHPGFRSPHMHPRIVQAFGPRGWEVLDWTLLPTRHSLRVLSQLGYTCAGIGSPARVADFDVKALLKPDRRPLLAGSLIGSKTRNAT
jgi:hypothetical protein